ncbi:hypothetical protein RSAG8_11599, partial [Rhizoctonia solani AG-8 WAC10335]
MDHNLGACRERPEEETCILVEEGMVLERSTRLARVLHLFDIRLNGKPTTITPSLIASGVPKNLEAIGIIGTLIGKEGLFAQCGWFGNHDLDWFWGRLTAISSISVRSDNRFRGGEMCMWLSTSRGDYAMILPHKTYEALWQSSLETFGKNGLAAKIEMLPACGPRPQWWDVHWQDAWPFEKSAHLKRRLSIATDEHENTSHATDDASMTTVVATVKWLRLGPRGDNRHPGQPRTHLNQLDPWIVIPDAGILPSSKPNGSGTHDPEEI